MEVSLFCYAFCQEGGRCDEYYVIWPGSPIAESAEMQR